MIPGFEMDSAHSHPSSPPSTSTNAHTTSLLQSPAPSTLPTHSKRYSEPTTSRQQRLLRNRNARFPTKKLSLSSLSSRFSQLIHANEESGIPSTSQRNQENVPLALQGTQVMRNGHSSASSLGILNEITNPTLNRKLRRSGDIPIHQDSPERPLLERSPFSSPAVYQDTSSQGYSPVGFDNFQDSLGNMRLREISGNEYRGSLLGSSPLNSSVRAVKKRKSFQIKAGFDAHEYIEHIEKELQEAKNEMFSPTTNKSLKDQLNTARYENEKLRQDMANMRDMFEAEVKRSIETRAEMEVELKRKVRDLEEELDQRTSVIRSLELHHDERRLDNNTIDTLKAAIEKLEQDRLSLEDENRSMSKRNEVLSELLAMSPTKLQAFELRSPEREKRAAGRPMSMIIPRLPSSPTGRHTSQPVSAVVSPSLSACGPFFSPVKSRTSSQQFDSHAMGLIDSERSIGTKVEPRGGEQSYFDLDGRSRQRSRRSTMQSQASLTDTASIHSNDSISVDQFNQRVLPKRKPRKFMAGSTQLKPLLLPSLTGEVVPLSSSSVLPSPQTETLRAFSQESIDPTTYFLSKAETNTSGHATAYSADFSTRNSADQCSRATSADYRTLEDIMAQHEVSSAVDPISELGLDTEEPSRSSSLDGTVLERHGGATDWLESISRTCSEAVTHLDRHEQHAPNAPAMSEFTEVLPVGSPKSMPQPRGLDLDALNQLQFPTPDYDLLPNPYASANETLRTDIPQPLFSLHAQPINPQYGMFYTSLSVNQEQWEHNNIAVYKHHPSRSRLQANQADVAPIPQAQSSWHVPENGRKIRRSYPSSAIESGSSYRSETPQRAPFNIAENFAKTRNPVELLHSHKFGARPLASLMIRTIFRTLSKCTGNIRDFKRDPMTLARRVLANAWLSNWARFGRLSWWVLGLFISTGLGGPKLREWEWERYDGEAIARRACQEHDTEVCEPTTISQENTTTLSHVRLQNSSGPTDSSASREKKTGWGRSMLLWGKFSVAIMLAVGGAVVKGPGEMLKEIDGRNTNQSCTSEISQASSSTSKDHCRTSKDGTYPHSDGVRKQMSDRRHDQCPHPLASARTSVVLERNPSRPVGPAIECQHRDNGPLRHFVCEGEDETLRAAKSPRKHVAAFFQSGGISNIENNRRNNGQPPRKEFNWPNIDTGTMNDGLLEWPPSPGLIDPEDSRPFYGS